MIAEHERVILTADLPEVHLFKGDVGTVVYVYREEAYEVEFLALDGKTAAVSTVEATSVRPLVRGIVHTVPWYFYQ